MNFVKSFSLFILLFLTNAFLSQHSKTIRFSRLTIKDGLTQSTINCLLQDQLGYIWIGTQDGLNRYDGYKIKGYKQNLNDVNGLSNSFINDLYQSKDGTIWIGTQNGGLNSYNPKTKIFSQISLNETLETGNIKDICEDTDGTLWVATAKNGVIHFSLDNTILEEFKASDGLFTNKTTSLYLSDNYVWIGTEGGGLCLLDKNTKKTRSFKKNSAAQTSISDNGIQSIVKGYNGQVLIGTNNGLNIAQFKEGKLYFTLVDNHSIHKENDFNVVSDIYPLSESEVWCGTQSNGLIRINFTEKDTLFSYYLNNDYDINSLSSNVINSIISDRTGSIWIGTQDGLSYFDPAKLGFQHYTYKYGDENSLNDKTVWSIFEENSNIVWVGTRKGVSRIDLEQNKYNHYLYTSNNSNEPNNHNVYSLKLDNFGRIWVGAAGGLYQLKTSSDFSKGEFIKVPFRDPVSEFDDDRVYNLYIENDTLLWVAAREGIAKINLITSKYNFFSHSNNQELPKEESRVILVDSKHTIWIGYVGAGIISMTRNVANGADSYKITSYKNDLNDTTSLSNNTVLSIWEDEKGMLWFGTYGGGLNKFDRATNSFTSYTEETHGLANNSIYGVLGGNNNSIWVSSNFGLSKFNNDLGTFQNFHESDGLQSNEFNNGAYYKSKTGKLYFGGINGFNAFYPEDIRSNKIPPRIVISNILLFNEPIENQLDTIGEVAFLKTVTLKYNQNNLTFKFSALHYTFPQGNNYKVFMEGVDNSVVILNDLQQINYSNLSPGEYTLKVWAANSDGVWSETPTELNIIITSPFWKKWWFITIAIGFFALVIYLGYVVRLQRVKSQKRKLSFLVEKRTRTITRQKEQMEAQKKALEIEKDKADRLLANILPAETAEELKNKGKAQTRYYRMVSVMFTDIKGFTKIAETIKPSDLVKRLDNLFREFDMIIEKHQIEKIKTIGDSYMAAGGVPLRDKENPINCVLAALEIQQVMDVYKEKTQEQGSDDFWQLRIGIHTGDVIAGVIGTKRIAYDIWGNTVNVANRMEMSGEPCKVNISGSTYDLVKPYFECTYRGKVPAKNKGEIDMYFVDRIKPHLSKDEKGIIPNEKFKEYVNLHIYSSINYRKAERHIMRILEEKLSPNLHYHGIHHTFDVVDAVERLAIMEGVLDDDIFVLKSAATYHDAGFVEQYEANEPVGARMAAEILPKYGYTQEQVNMVEKLIYATIVPHNPGSKLEKIICDADLDYLGRDDFHTIADSLRRELRDHGKIKSDRLWDEIQVKFLTQHKYFTDSAIKLRRTKKMQHLEEIKQRLLENNYKD